MREKQRAIFTNDAECDDMNSVVHLLLYANEIDIEGLVLSSSIFHYAGDPAAGIEPKRWAGGQWMWDYIDAYEQCLPNLRAHDPAYPSADALRAVTCIGNVRTTGDMAEDTDGSELIRRAIFRDDPRTLYLLAGGGTNTIARALRHIEEEFRGTDEWEAVYRQVCEKVVIYMIITQDDTYRDYISQAWPGIRLLHCTALGGIGFIFGDKVCGPEVQRIMRAPWLEANLLGKGPLMERYHTWADGHVYPGEQDRSQFGSNPALLNGNWWGRENRRRHDMISEGDSPSFLYLVDRGLRSLEDPTWGGWGGRFMRNPRNEFNPEADVWQSTADDDCGTVLGTSYQFSRWIPDFMSEFAVRASWCVEAEDARVNHAPVLEVEGGVDVEAEPGSGVELAVSASDPDGDTVDITWWRYHEADRYPGGVSLDPDGAACKVLVPADARPGDTIHVICRASDESAHADGYLCAYARIVITVR